MICPCGGGPYAACCGPRHDGSAPAPTAEALMRSRYSAYALGKGDYLAATQRAPFDATRLNAGLVWVGLQVHEATVDRVAFTARYLAGNTLGVLKERSSFEQRDGRWIYTDGEPSLTEEKVERNQPCPCGSGRKFKSCHA